MNQNKSIIKLKLNFIKIMLKFIKSKLKFNQINFKTYKTQNLIFINRN